jgi:hypothetical protein
VKEEGEGCAVFVAFACCCRHLERWIQGRMVFGYSKDFRRRRLTVDDLLIIMKKHFTVIQ